MLAAAITISSVIFLFTIGAIVWLILGFARRIDVRFKDILRDADNVTADVSTITGYVEDISTTVDNAFDEVAPKIQKDLQDAGAWFGGLISTGKAIAKFAEDAKDESVKIIKGGIDDIESIF